MTEREDLSTALATLVEGMQFVGEAGSGHAVVMDGGPGFGRDTGTRPIEFLLVGLAGCTGMDVVHILRKQRVEVRSFQVAVKARRAEKHPKVYTWIEIEYRVSGPDIRLKHLEKAVTLSATKFCSASVILGKTAEIVHKYRLENAEGTREGVFEIHS